MIDITRKAGAAVACVSYGEPNWIYWVADPSTLHDATNLYLKSWRCFHCGETFESEDEARLHFGATERETVACQIDGGVLAEVRRLNAELARYREEDSDKDREMHRQQNEHAVALRRAEEDGYAKGLHAAPEYSASLQAERDAAIAGKERAQAEVRRFIEQRDAAIARAEAAEEERGAANPRRYERAVEALVRAGDVLQSRVDVALRAIDSAWAAAGGMLDSPAFERTRAAMAKEGCDDRC